MTATILEKPSVGFGDETTVYNETSNEAGKSAHIVLIPAHLRGKTTAQALVMDARVNGKTIEALCGHRWIPSQNPLSLPLCSKCKAIYEQPGEHRDSRDELPEA